MQCPSVRDLPRPPVGKNGWPWTEEGPRLQDNLPDGRPWPRVSIITPSYNQARYIEETIRSVLLQGCPDLEYIIIDGGSHDGSVEIIRKYEPWLAYWISEPDQGQTHAINKGWQYATGEILAYLNSDDYYLPAAVAVAAKAFAANPEVGMVYGSALIIDEKGKELRVWKGQTFDLKTMLTVGSIVPQPGTFFAKHALQRVGYLEEQWLMIMDYELSIRMALQFPTVCLPATLAKFRDHLQSKTHSQHEKMAEELIRWLGSFSPPQVPPEQWRILKRIMLSRVHYEWALNHLAGRNQHVLRALLHLIQSLLQYPLFALMRPLDTAYLIKEICLSPITGIYTR